MWLSWLLLAFVLAFEWLCLNVAVLAFAIGFWLFGFLDFGFWILAFGFYLVLAFTCPFFQNCGD